MHTFCKRGALSAALALALSATPAAAQFVPNATPTAPVRPTVTSIPAAGFVPPASGVYPGLYPGYSSYYDPFGGYFRGVGDLISSYGQYSINVNQARLVNQQVEQEKIRTRRMILEQHRYEQSLLPTVEEVRAKQREIALRRALNDPPLPEIISGDALNVLLKNLQSIQGQGSYGPTVPLEDDLLKHVQVVSPHGGNIAVFKDDGKLKWPLALRDTPFEEPRKKFQELTAEALKQVATDDLQPATVNGMKAALASLEQVLEKNAPDMEISHIVEARRYLSELRDGMRALQDPNVSNYASKKWSAQGRDVRELVQYMTKEGLQFAASGRGDEAAYRALHRALVNYNYGAAQARR
ncbi:MAG: hypothetical protein HYS12_13065 [Planctomycetes bacterium]|nr:hypothetical protein [Planctomycetota bacterium]